MSVSGRPDPTRPVSFDKPLTRPVKFRAPPDPTRLDPRQFEVFRIRPAGRVMTREMPWYFHPTSDVFLSAIRLIRNEQKKTTIGDIVFVFGIVPRLLKYRVKKNDSESRHSASKDTSISSKLSMTHGS